MPHISVSVSTTGDVLSYEVASDLTILDLKGFINAETDIPVESQVLSINGRELSDGTQTLQAAGIVDHDMVGVTVKPLQTSQSQSSRSNPGSQQVQIHPRIEGLRQQLLSSSEVRSQMAALSQQVVDARHDPVRFQEAFVTFDRARQQEEQARLAALDDDVTEENQAAIAEHIRQQNIQKERERAEEENPEFFASVIMLYVDVLVNGHPVKAFVDSGAQATIMSPSCAESCGITRLIDKRFAGIAVGVGTAKILGRVHRADITIGDAELPCAFTVMEGKDVDMLLGLDMLKRYQASIDLSQNRLIFPGGVSVPFLGEHEIPKKWEEAMDDEPTVEGPGGTKIGAQSGAVKPAISTGTSGTPSASNNFAGEGRALGLSSSTTPVSRPSAPTPSQAAPGFPQTSIDALVNIGATRAQAIEALNATGGNIELAAGLIYDM